MSMRGLSAYKASVYSRGASDSTKHLASLLSHSSVNSRMLGKAYAKLEDKTGKKYLVSSENVTIGSSGGIDYTKAAEELKKSSAALMDSSVKLLGAKKMSDSELMGEVKAFVDSYNSTVDSLTKSDNLLAKSSGNNLTANTKAYSYPLSKAGITVNEDNTLTLDEDAMKANPENARALFKGAYSFGARAASKISDLQNYAKLSGNSGTGIYSRYGMINGLL